MVWNSDSFIYTFYQNMFSMKKDMMPPEQRFRHIYLEKRNNQERTFSKYLFKNDFFFQIIHLETI